MKKILLFTSMMLLTSCSQSLEKYNNNTPSLDLQQFFNGHLVAHGIVQDYKGDVIRRFSATINGHWQGNKGTIDEVFQFDDGKTEFRCWKLNKQGNRYTGIANDVVGKALGQTIGNTLNWHYTLAIKTDDSELNVTLDDWIYLINSNTAINRTQMSYWGLPVGDITLSITKVSDTVTSAISPVCNFDTQSV